MEEKTVHVAAISCGHCTNTIQREVGDLDGVIKVVAESSSKNVTVQWEPPVTWESISELLTEIGYPADK